MFGKGEIIMKRAIKTASAILLALGLEDAAESSKGQTMFDDVSAEHWANGYINLAVSQGIIFCDF